MQSGKCQDMRGAAAAEGGDSLPGRPAAVSRKQGREQGSGLRSGEGDGADQGAERFHRPEGQAVPEGIGLRVSCNGRREGREKPQQKERAQDDSRRDGLFQGQEPFSEQHRHGRQHQSRGGNRAGRAACHNRPCESPCRKTHGQGFYTPCLNHTLRNYVIIYYLCKDIAEKI